MATSRARVRTNIDAAETLARYVTPRTTVYVVRARAGARFVRVFVVESGKLRDVGPATATACGLRMDEQGWIAVPANALDPETFIGDNIARVLKRGRIDVRRP